jgi:hypothetical protein
VIIDRCLEFAQESNAAGGIVTAFLQVFNAAPLNADQSAPFRNMSLGFLQMLPIIKFSHVGPPSVS